MTKPAMTIQRAQELVAKGATDPNDLAEAKKLLAENAGGIAAAEVKAKKEAADKLVADAKANAAVVVQEAEAAKKKADADAAATAAAAKAKAAAEAKADSELRSKTPAMAKSDDDGAASAARDGR